MTYDHPIIVFTQYSPRFAWPLPEGESFKLGHFDVPKLIWTYRYSQMFFKFFFQKNINNI